MRWILVIAMVMTWGAVTGCQSGVSQDRVMEGADAQSVRSALLKVEPRALVGVVSEVLPDERFAAVRDIPVEEIGVGQIVSFIDLNQSLLTHGQVVRVVNGSLHVMYDPPSAGGRAPRAGDLAVRFR